MKHSQKSGRNKYFLLASLSLTATALLTPPQPLGGSYVNAVSYVTLVMALVFGGLGLARKDAKVSTKTASQLVLASSLIYAVLGLLMVWVILAELALAPKVPLLSDFEFVNYLIGWPVVELVILGTVVNALLKVTRAAWVDYLGGSLMVLSIIIWQVATYYGLLPGV